MRITGGQYRSRSLVAPRGDATRPTSDRVREALFAILGPTRLEDARILDLYAGTGALAFESLSRGAARATLVESARPAVQAITENAKALGVTARVHVVPTAVERASAAVRRLAPYDLVFADPPYASVANGDATRALLGLLREPSELLAPRARLVVEHAKGDAPPSLAAFTLVETRRYGDTSLSFFSWGAPDDVAGPVEDGD